MTVTDLQPYIGAIGPLVIISGTQTYLQPSQQLTDGAFPDTWRSRRRVPPVFPRPGRYKVWGQFKRGERSSWRTSYST